MSGLDDIRVAVIEADESEGGLRDNVRAILQEIASLLEALVETGAGPKNSETRTIDIRSLPFLPGDYEALEDALGTGEITAEFDGGYGPTEIFETGISGVWWIKHFNEEGDISAEFIEITRIPEILLSQEEDMRDSLEALREQLGNPPGH
jgi:hydrogenase-1 operon protein HyaF